MPTPTTHAHDRSSPFGPVSAVWLAGIGVRTLDELRAMGAVEAFGRVRAREGRRAVTRNMLYALHALLSGRRWDEVDETTKARLCAEAGIDPPRRRRAPQLGRHGA